MTAFDNKMITTFDLLPNNNTSTEIKVIDKNKEVISVSYAEAGIEISNFTLRKYV